jgi:hypothetical protein
LFGDAAEVVQKDDMHEGSRGKKAHKKEKKTSIREREREREKAKTR